MKRNFHSPLFVVILVFFTFFAVQARTSQSRTTQRIQVKTAERHDAPVGGEVELYRESCALVIGIDDYREKGWPRLSNAVKDARLVALPAP